MSIPRTPLIVLTSVAAIVIFVASLITLYLVDFGTCSGDGGSPYSAPDSVAGRFCDGPLHQAWVLALIFGPTAAFLGLAILGIRRARDTLAAAGLVLAAAVFAALVVPVALLPQNCSDADLETSTNPSAEEKRSGDVPNCSTY